MDIAAFDRREQMLKLRKELLSVEEDRFYGENGYSVSEVTSMIKTATREATRAKNI